LQREVLVRVSPQTLGVKFYRFDTVVQGLLQQDERVRCKPPDGGLGTCFSAWSEIRAPCIILVDAEESSTAVMPMQEWAAAVSASKFRMDH
jgi:hypothetical protein